MSSSTRFENLVPNPHFEGVEDVSPEEVSQKLGGLCLIDVRSDEEFHGELGHIQSSKLMTLDSLPDRVSELPKEKTIVFICRSGMRSAKAAALAKEHGHSDAFNLQGGMILWNQKGYPVEQ